MRKPQVSDGRNFLNESLSTLLKSTLTLIVQASYSLFNNIKPQKNLGSAMDPLYILSNLLSLTNQTGPQ